MPRSTGRFIAYDLRPAKQTERRILLEVLRSAGECGLPISSYRYIGMGSIRFYDFLLMHRYLGIRDMISLEHDSGVFPRAEFNNPYKFIKVQQQIASDFIDVYESTKPTVFWLDYDGGIGAHIVRDVSVLCTKMAPGDFLFVTVYGGPPRHIGVESARRRLVWLEESMPDLSGVFSESDLENANFENVVHKILYLALRDAFAPREDGKFKPYLQVKYADSTPMVTVGGGLLDHVTTDRLIEKLDSVIPFLETERSELYGIRSFNLSDRERSLFDRAATTSRRRVAERTMLSRLGFDDQDIVAYGELLRFLPRYVETML